MPTPPRLASTVLLIRDADTPSGLQVFMLQRHRRSGFLPNAWVFPGGRVEEQDALAAHPRLRGGERTLAALGLPPPRGLPLLLAAARETYEESGIWLGQPTPPTEARDALNAGHQTIRDVLDRHDSTLELDRLLPWAWWVTPRAEPRRYDTRFFVGLASGGGRHDERETTASRWICPTEALQLGQVDFPVAPPTWWTLRELAGLGSTVAVLDAVPRRPNRPIEPVMRFDEHGLQLLLPGHPEHPEAAFPGLPHEVRAVARRWVAQVDGEPISLPGAPAADR